MLGLLEFVPALLWVGLVAMLGGFASLYARRR